MDKQSNSLQQVYATEFDGQPIIAVRFRGQWCWVAAQVGRAIGYARGDRFADKFTGDWVDETIEGKDFEVLRHSDLNDFRKLWKEPTETGGSRQGRITILYEPGLHLAPNGLEHLRCIK